MADEENNEPKKRGGLVKILLFAFGGIALIGIGLGVGFVLFGSTQPDPSEEIEQIIERKMEEADAEKLAEEEAARESAERAWGEHLRAEAAAREASEARLGQHVTELLEGLARVRDSAREELRQTDA